MARKNSHDLSNDPIRTALREKGIKLNSKQEIVLPEDPRPDIPDRQDEPLTQINGLEDLLKPVNQSVGISPLDEALAEERREKIELAKAFMSEEMQKTELTRGERKMLPLLRIMAINPFGSNKMSHIHNELDAFIDEYLAYGISVNRAGRKEEVAVLQGLFRDQAEISAEISAEGGAMEKLRKFGR